MRMNAILWGLNAMEWDSNDCYEMSFLCYAIMFVVKYPFIHSSIHSFIHHTVLGYYWYITFAVVKCIIFYEAETFVYNVLGLFGMARNLLFEV